MFPRAPRPVLDSTHFGRTPRPFLFSLAVGCLIAIGAFVVVAAQRGPAPAVVSLLLTLLPIPFLVALILFLDRLEPEPRALLFAIFGAGAGTAAVTLLIGRLFDTGVVTTPELGPHAGRAVAISAGAAIGGAIVAESLQGLVLIGVLRSRRAEIDGSHDGVVYAAMTGLGFALVANVYAYTGAWNAGAAAMAEDFATRGIFSPVFQALCTSMIGLGIAYVAERRSGGHWAIAAGWAGAVVLDALWNRAVQVSGGTLALTYLILIIALVAVIIIVVADRQRLVMMITSFLPAFEDPEVVTASDIPMLASLRWRRLGRQWARLELGVDGMRAMAEYQLAATELAMACNRNSLGRTTEEAFTRHRDDSLTLMRHAAALVRNREMLHPPPWMSMKDRSVFVDPDTAWPPPPPRFAADD